MSEQDLENTIGLIYETVADPTLWAEVARSASIEIGASASWMFQPSPAGPSFFAINGIPDDVIQAYFTHFHRTDVLVQGWQRRITELAGRPLRERDIVDERTWLGSEMYNDLCVPCGVGQILTAPLSEGTGGTLPPILSFFRPPGCRAFPGSLGSDFSDPAATFAPRGASAGGCDPATLPSARVDRRAARSGAVGRLSA